jgi:hypothetical protein
VWNGGIAHNLIDAKVARVSKYVAFGVDVQITLFEKTKIMLFAVAEVESKNLFSFFVDHKLCFECMTFLFAGIVVFLLVFTVFCLFFSGVLSVFLKRR